VKFAGAITFIGDYAFDDCERVNHVYIGTTTSLGSLSIGNNAFRGCIAFVSMNVNFSNTATNTLSIGNYTFYNCVNFKEIYQEVGSDGIFTITSIGDGAFFGCASLKLNSFSNMTYDSSYEEKTNENVG
jgi:hypothetical protein